MTEIERKYTVPLGFTLPDLAAAAGVAIVGEPVDVPLDAVYYDTLDLLLARHRITLRRRVGGDDEGWHLKRPAGTDRTETREPLSPGDVVPESLANQVRALTRAAPIAPVVRIRTRRREFAVQDDQGHVLAMVADDSVTTDLLTDPAAPASQWRELEVELVDGPRGLLDRIEDILLAWGASRAVSPSKLAQALGDRYPIVHGGDDLTVTRGNAGAAIRAYLRAQRDAIVDNDPRVRDGETDGVHDMRVAVRRARAALRTFRPVVPDDRAEPLRGELHWLAGLLGGVRDGDVIQARVAHALESLAPEEIIGPVGDRVRQQVAADAARARDKLTAGLDGDRYIALLGELDHVADAEPPRVTAKRLRRRVRTSLHRADAKLDQAMRLRCLPADAVPLPSDVPQDRDVALHEARKAYKRARYGVEAITPLIGRRGERLADRLGGLQDVLGDHQDSVVAAHLLRDFGVRAHLAGENAFTYGMLYEREVSIAERRLDALSKARRRTDKYQI
jgi:CHAD domain-containing protein